MKKKKLAIQGQVISLMMIVHITLLVVLYSCNLGEVQAASGDTFTHQHSSGCYQTVEYQCNTAHTYSEDRDTLVKHCLTCDAQTNHTDILRYARCPYLPDRYRIDEDIYCNVCGRHYAGWSWQESHMLTRQELCCPITEGAATGVLHVSSGQTAWTKGPVALYASVSLMDSSLHLSPSPYSWNAGSWSASGEYSVTQNGLYSASARNAEGAVVTASITVNNIDTVAPVIQHVTEDTTTMTKDQIEVQVQAEDGTGEGSGTSGLAESAFSFDGGASWQQGGKFVLEEGRSYVLVVRDKAGNEVRQNLSRSSFSYPPEPVLPPVEEVEEPLPPETSEETSEARSEANPGGLVKEESPTPNKAQETAETPKESIPQVQAPVKTIPQASKPIKQTIPAWKSTGVEEKEETKVRKQPVKVELDYQKEAKTFLEKEPVKNVTEEPGERFESEETAGSSEAIETIKVTSPPSITYAAAGTTAILVALLGLLFLMLCRVTVFCYTEDCQYERLGKVKMKFSKGGFRMCLSSKLMEKASFPRYRVAVPRILLWNKKNSGLTVDAGTQEFTLALEEFVDFVL